MSALKHRLATLFADHCDFVEITELGGKLWLRTCWNRNTTDDSGQWVDETGARRNWDYVHREVVASGDDEAALWKDAQEYHRMLGMTMEEYLMEQVAKTT